MKNKFGKFGLRIFRYLLKNKYAEEKIISRQTMLSKNETRKALYDLMQQKFVQVQEVPKRADRYAKHSFFLWSVASWPHIFVWLLGWLFVFHLDWSPMIMSHFCPLASRF